MTVPVVSILTADLGPQLEQENASLLCRIDELVAEVEHWKALWRQNLENASAAMSERDEAVAKLDLLEAKLYAASDELGSVRGELAQERAKNKRRGW